MSSLCIASLSVLGQPCSNPQDNSARSDLTCAAIELAYDNCPDLTALILPGGMFAIDAPLRNKNTAERLAAIDATAWAQQIMPQVPPHISLFAGIDVQNPKEPVGHYSCHLDAQGVRAVSRKLFFPKAELAQGAFSCPKDFSDFSRITTLSNGTSVLMNSCYDIFGSADAMTSEKAAFKRLNKQKHIAAPHKKQLCKQYHKMLRSRFHKKAQLVISNIHHFSAPGRDIFFQRHGIATASAAFKGATAIGAAHFSSVLPEHETQSPLCASNVATSHLTARYHRQAHACLPVMSHIVEASEQHGVLKIFKLNSF